MMATQGIIAHWDEGHDSHYNPGVHRFSVFVVLWTVLLFVAGALVTSKDAALSRYRLADFSRHAGSPAIVRFRAATCLSFRTAR